jgi:Acetyltransferase (GNAT) domain
MAALPIFEEQAGGGASTMIAGLAGLDLPEITKVHFEDYAKGASGRRLSAYAASAGFDLQEELEYLTYRAVEPNIFFNPRFLAPAMPRLDDREIRFMVLRDEREEQSRLRFLMPYSIERPGFGVGVPIIRSWSTPFGPLGAPLIDREDPVGIAEDVFEVLSRPHLKLPEVLMIPDIRVNGAVASALRQAAIGRNLPVITTDRSERPNLHSRSEGDLYVRLALGSHHRREFQRMERRLAQRGKVEFTESRHPDDVRRRTEEFLSLEASGWKGRRRTAMAVDRFRAAFAREALYCLAERDMCRIHTLDLDGRAIASLVVMRETGVAYTWKTAFDEGYSSYSPGTLLMIDTTKKLLEDINISRVDSLATPDHPMMSRLWKEREQMGTLVIGLKPSSDRATRQAASQLNLYRRSQNVARTIRDKIVALAGKG